MAGFAVGEILFVKNAVTLQQHWSYDWMLYCKKSSSRAVDQINLSCASVIADGFSFVNSATVFKKCSK